MIKPFSLAKWEGMSPKMKWDILTAALRGPDQRHHAIKWFTTSVLRHALQEVLMAIIGKPAGGMVNSSLSCVVLPSPAKQFKEKGGGEYKEVIFPCSRCKGAGKMPVSEGPPDACPFCVEGEVKIIQHIPATPVYPRIAWFDLTHFADHIQEGAMFLGIQIFWVPFEIWLEAMETDYIPSAIEILLAKTVDADLHVALKQHAQAEGWGKYD